MTFQGVLRDPWSPQGRMPAWVCKGTHWVTSCQWAHQWWAWQGYLPPFPSQRWGWYRECQRCGVREYV